MSQITTDEKQFVAVWDDGSVSCLNAEEAGRSIDSSDCYEPFKLLFNDGGELVPVTVENQSRCSNDDMDMVLTIYAISDMMANGKVVGRVKHTDH